MPEDVQPRKSLRVNPHVFRFLGRNEFNRHCQQIMNPNIAELIVKTLAAAGVKRIYGVVGDSLNGLTEALRIQKSIEWLNPAAARQT